MIPVTISFAWLRAMLVLVRAGFSLAVVGFSKALYEPSPQTLVNEFILVPMVLTIFASLAWYPIRYREALFTTFNVVLGWHDVNSATYSRLGRLIRLQSPKLATTIAIMSNHKSSFSPEYESARSMIRNGLQGQWREQWL